MAPPRLTGLLVDNGDCGLIHVGADYAYINPARDQLQIASQDEVFVGQQPNLGPTGLSVVPIDFVPPFVQSGVFTVNNVNFYNLEGAVSLGRSLIQAESRWASIDTPTGSAVVPAAYLHWRYMLTC